MINIYSATQENFEKEINLALEISIKEEFDKRCDDIERQISNKLMDTSAFIIIAEKDKQGVYVYNVANKLDLNDVSNGMSLSSLNIPVIKGDTVNRRKISDGIAKMIRVADLETRTLYYRTQQLGNYVDSLNKKNDFNEAKLKILYDRNLGYRNINIPYQLFYTKNIKGLAKFADEKSYLTRLHLTYERKHKNVYVGAKFGSPFTYVATKMALGFGCSVLLVFGIAICLSYLLKSLFREKKLADIKNDFISNITHEFKTPIATISVAIEALTSFDVLQDEKKTHRYLGYAKTELIRLSGIVDQILAIALFRNKDVSLVKEQISLSLVLTELIEMQQLSADKSIKFDIDPQQLNYNLNVNKMQFYHAINNVLDNAVKYAGNHVEIAIRTLVKDGFLLISIADNGFGIKSEDLPLVFEQFYRSPAISNKNLKGYGLGLNYVRYIMQQHNGWCKVESVFGKGSSFTLAWPL